MRPRQLLTEFHHGMYGIARDKTAIALNVSILWDTEFFQSLQTDENIRSFWLIALESAEAQ